jgi:hypothetical protein
MARAAILPDVEDGTAEEAEAAADENSEGETEAETEGEIDEAATSEDQVAASPTLASENSPEADEQQLQDPGEPADDSTKEEGAD